MSLEYEVWLTDDAGRRMALLDEISYLSYTRAVHQYGAIEFAIPFRPFQKQFLPWFRPDWRLEVWRSPAHGYPMRREDVYLLRKPNVYTRSEDNMQMLRFYGRNGWDLLNRRNVIQRAGTQWSTKTDYADDMMKAIVREQMLYGSALDEDGVLDAARAWPENEFMVQGDASLGPQITHSFEGKRVLEVLKEIKAVTFQKNVEDSANLRVFYDVIPANLSGSSPLGWNFITRAGLYGSDRTSGIEFSLENENMKSPTYSISHMDEANSIYILGSGRGNTQIIEYVEDLARINISRWNRCENVISASNETDTAGLTSRGNAELENSKPVQELPVTFLNTPGTSGTPRSLYGIDWDLGDRVRVSYAGLQFDVEINLVYVSVDENGSENLTGRNEVNSA